MRRAPLALAAALAVLSASGLRAQTAAPEIALKDLNGAVVKLSDQKGKVVLLDFFATWCGNCKKTLPTVKKIAAAYPKDLVVLQIDREEDAATVKKYAEKEGNTMTILLDSDGAVHKTYGVQGNPTFALINRGGGIVWAKATSADATMQEMEKKAAELVAQR